MDFKIKVTGRAQNSTALGIIHAYMQMFPKTTLADLRRVFPNDIAPDKGVSELFLPVDEAEAFNQKMSLYFVKDERPVTLSDGSQIALTQVWSGKSLANLTAIAEKLGIQAEINKDSDKEMNKSGFNIEYLNGWKPATPPKGCLGMLLLLVILGGGLIGGVMKLM